MVHLNSTEWNTLIATLLFPMVRVLAFFAAAPFFSSNAIPRRVRLMIGIGVCFGLLPMIPAMPAVEAGSGIGLWVLAQQIAIGVGMGFVMRIIMSAIALAGDQMAMQMGLGFATLYDPQGSGQTSVVPEFVSILATLIFLSINGHLMMVAALAESFRVIPVSVTALPAPAWFNLAVWGSKIFALGLALALPIIVALVITNIGLGVLSRAAPQLNLMAIGFPITLTVGFVSLGLMLSYFAVPITHAFQDALRVMLEFPG